MDRIKEIKKEIKSIDKKIDSLREEQSSLKKEQEQIELAPKREKYEGKYFRFAFKSYAYIRELVHLDDDFICTKGVNLYISDDCYAFTNKEEFMVNEAKEITREEFEEVASKIKKQLDADYANVFK